MKYKLVYIEWEDAIGISTRWTKRDQIIKDHREKNIIKEVGWIIFEDKRKVILASSRDRYGNFTDGTDIPKGLVRKRKILRLNKEEKK